MLNAPALEAIETLIVPRARDIGGFEVRRALPAPKRQMVGPFIFFDAPVRVFSETFYADADLRPGSLLPLPDDHEDRGLYVVEGSISVAGQALDSSQMMVF